MARNTTHGLQAGDILSYNDYLDNREGERSNDTEATLVPVPTGNIAADGSPEIEMVYTNIALGGAGVTGEGKVTPSSENVFVNYDLDGTSKGTETEIIIAAEGTTQYTYTTVDRGFDIYLKSFGVKSRANGNETLLKVDLQQAGQDIGTVIIEIPAGAPGTQQYNQATFETPYLILSTGGDITATFTNLNTTPGFSLSIYEIDTIDVNGNTLTNIPMTEYIYSAPYIAAGKSLEEVDNTLTSILESQIKSETPVNDINRAREELNSYVAVHYFTSLGQTNLTSNMAITVPSGKTVSVIEVRPGIKNLGSDSIYTISMTNSQVDSYSGGTAAQFDVNEITREAQTNVYVNVTATTVIGIPFAGVVVKNIQDQSFFGTDFYAVETGNLFESRDLARFPIYYKNTSGSDKYIIIEAEYNDEVVSGSTTEFDALFAVFYTIT